MAGDSDGTPAVVYDPRTNKLVSTTPPTQLGEGFAITTLRDGRVLVAGGSESTGERAARNQIWDPATGRWLVGPRMNIARGWPAMVTLRDGRVLAAGGIDLAGGDDVDTVAVAEIYDPSTNRWTRTGSMEWTYESFGVVALAGGQVLALWTDPFEEHGSAHTAIYDPDRGKWAEVDSPEDVTWVDRLVALPDGTALHVGWTGAISQFDPETGWRGAGNLGGARIGPAFAVLENGHLLVAGGESRNADETVTALKSAELFDPESARSVDAAPMPVARAGGIAIALQDGSVFVAGGYEAIHADGTTTCPAIAYRAIRWVP